MFLNLWTCVRQFLWIACSSAIQNLIIYLLSWVFLFSLIHAIFLYKKIDAARSIGKPLFVLVLRHEAGHIALIHLVRSLWIHPPHGKLNLIIGLDFRAPFGFCLSKSEHSSHEYWIPFLCVLFDVLSVFLGTSRFPRLCNIVIDIYLQCPLPYKVEKKLLDVETYLPFFIFYLINCRAFRWNAYY